jgi:hypothetical protein
MKARNLPVNYQLCATSAPFTARPITLYSGYWMYRQFFENKITGHASCRIPGCFCQCKLLQISAEYIAWFSMRQHTFASIVIDLHATLCRRRHHASDVWCTLCRWRHHVSDVWCTLHCVGDVWIAFILDTLYQLCVIVTYCQGFIEWRGGFIPSMNLTM